MIVLQIALLYLIVSKVHSLEEILKVSDTSVLASYECSFSFSCFTVYIQDKVLLGYKVRAYSAILQVSVYSNLHCTYSYQHLFQNTGSLICFPLLPCTRIILKISLAFESSAVIYSVVQLVSSVRYFDFDTVGKHVKEELSNQSHLIDTITYLF